MRLFAALIQTLFLIAGCHLAVAQVPMTGAGLGTPTVVVGYQGAGDIFSTGVIGAYSCSQAYNAAFAALAGSICDIVDTTTGVATCTIPIGTNGSANLTAVVCPTSAPVVNVVTFCTVTHAAGCSITKVYDQSGSGRDVVQATLANMPTLILSSTPLGTLPAINCGTGTTLLLTSAGTVTQAQPITMSAVIIRKAGTTAGGAVGGSSGIFMGSGTANLAEVSAGTALTASVTDNVWYSLQGLLAGNGTSSAINYYPSGGSDTDTLGAAGTTGLSAANTRVCRGNSQQFDGLVAEAIIYGATSTPTQRTNLANNQHTRYGF